MRARAWRLTRGSCRAALHPHFPPSGRRTSIRSATPPSVRRCAASGVATVTAAVESEEHEKGQPARRTITRQVDERHHVVKLLGASTQEYGLHMSLSSGVPLFPSGLEKDGSFQALRYQADVNCETKLGKLMVDQEEHLTNYQLWIELLQFRRRVDGFGGVLDVWYGMRRRNIDLPTVGESAKTLWNDFIDAALVRNGTHKISDADIIRHEIYGFAKSLKDRTGEQYPDLYKGLVGHLFRIDVAGMGRACHWHRRMMSAGLVSPGNALKQIAADVLQNTHPVFRTFRTLYKQNTAERDCYDVVVPLAARLRPVDEVLKYHRLFMKHSDGPSTPVFNTPAVQQLFELDQGVSLPMKLGTHPHDPAFIAASDLHETVKYPPITRASMSALVGDVHGIKPKELSDSFVSKMFATSAFSIDLVIRGLNFFAVESLGPLALREMATRAGSPVELCNKIGSLKDAGIKVAEHGMYARLMLKLAAEGHTDLFNALLASDQHPEGYDDIRTQEALLVSYLEAESWTQVHLTMTCLTLAGVALEGKAVNRLAQHYIRTRAWRLAAQTIEKMKKLRLPLTSVTIAYLWRYLLPERRKGMRPQTSQRSDPPPFDALDFVANAYMYSDALSRNVPGGLWKEILKRYGMASRWDELERLVLWLAARYKPQAVRTMRTRRVGKVATVNRTGLGKLEEVFTEQMQQALFTWGFRAAAARNQPCARALQVAAVNPTKVMSLELSSEQIERPEVSWTQGLRLLRQLKYYGLAVHDSTVRQAFWTRMWILFGPAYSTKAVNRLERENNKLRLADFLRQGQAAYDDMLVSDLHPNLLEDDTPNEAVLKRATGWTHG
ncbi:hypothetical protein LTR82_015001 [Friedmanniomyces endolithicus]|uniref:Pentatricopeptide repeat domain-containing protein n=1 Tax=Friedmanniomyces endolithicus TaxID=329885 RepID=A0AAN6J2J5_9PEZI|nr:hypothetical protein LTR82_015001 [Friedmanniomyces endolithicus]